MDNKNQSLTGRDIWEIVSRKSVTNQNVIHVPWYFKCKRKPNWTMRKYNARYSVRRDAQKRLSPESLKPYSPVVQWATVRLILILQCILSLESQNIDFTNDFVQSDIPSVNTVFIELPMDFRSDEGQYDVVLRLKKILHGQSKATSLWYEN